MALISSTAAVSILSASFCIGSWDTKFRFLKLYFARQLNSFQVLPFVSYRLDMNLKNKHEMVMSCYRLLICPLTMLITINSGKWRWLAYTLNGLLYFATSRLIKYYISHEKAILISFMFLKLLNIFYYINEY